MSNLYNLNVVTLGRSGVGKSSLLNYLLGNYGFKTGVGRPVTQAGFDEKKTVIADVPVTIIDSYGIESGSNFEKWKRLIEEKIKEHDLSHSIDKWLHVIMYCLSAEDSRVQPIDSEIINRFCQEGIRMIVVITHADRCGEAECRILKDYVLASCPKVKEDDFVEICSVGTPEEFSGHGLREMIIEQYLDNILQALTPHCISRAMTEIDQFLEQKRIDIRNRSYSIFDNDSIHAKWLEEDCRQFVERFSKVIFPAIIRESIEQSAEIATNLGHVLKEGSKASGIRGDFNISFNTSLGKSSNLWEEDDPFWEKLMKGILVTVFWGPLAIGAVIYLLVKGEDNVKQELTRAAEAFCDDMKDRVKNSKSILDAYFDDVKSKVLTRTQ